MDHQNQEVQEENPPPNPLLCNVCQEDSINLGKARSHRSRAHRKTHPYMCKLCFHVFESESDYHEHYCKSHISESQLRHTKTNRPNIPNPLPNKQLEIVIKTQIPRIQSPINKRIAELESELSHLGMHVSIDAGSSGGSFVLESIVGKDFLPRGSGIVTQRPLVLQLHGIDVGREYAEFLHQPRKRFTDFAAVRKDIADEINRETGRSSKRIPTVPIHLSIYSPKVVNLTLIGLPGLTKVAVDGQSDSIVHDIKNIVRSYIKKTSVKSSVSEILVGKDFLPHGSGIVTRQPFVLQLYKIDEGREYAEFLHQPKRFTDFAAVTVRKQIADETDRETGRSSKQANSPNAVNLTLIDLPRLTKVVVDGQPDSIVLIENMIRSYIEKPNCIILVISPANQDLATSDAIKISREVDPKGERTFGVLTKIDPMDKGIDSVDILEAKAYRLQFPWIGVVNRSQADINKSVDMIAARRREREYFANTPEYRHLAHRMGSEHLGKMMSKHLETVIKTRIPGIQSLINKSIGELESELSRLGKPVATDARGKLYMIMELCRIFYQIYKEHLDGICPGGDKIYNIFDNQLPAALRRLQFDKQLSMENVRKLITEADGCQPHLIALEQGYRRLIESSLVTIRGPAEAAVDEAHSVLKELVHKAISETMELKQYPSLRVEVIHAAVDSLDRMRDESRKATLKLVDMESSYLTVDFFRKLPQDIEKGGNPTHSIFDRYNDSYLRRIGTNVLAYVNMVFGTLRISIPKSIVYCQAKQLSNLLDEDPAVMERRTALAKRLELYRSALQRG